jgi:hypothetical protein
MNQIEKAQLRSIIKAQLLADIDAYQMFVEEEDFDHAEDAALNCWESLSALQSKDYATWVVNNEWLEPDTLAIPVVRRGR